MNEMYSTTLDVYGPPLEPEDDYYFRPRWDVEQEEETDDE